MYWRDVYKSSADAAKALAMERSGRVMLSPRARLAAVYAVQSHRLGDLEGMDGLNGGFKSLLKKAKSLSPSHALAKKLAPKLYKKVEKIEPAGLLKVNKKSSPKTPPASVAASASANTNLPVALDPSSFTQPAGFNTFSSGGGGGAVAPADPNATAATDEGMSLPVMLGIGAGAVFLLYLLTKRH